MRFKACSVVGCNSNAHRDAKGSLGMCRSHYSRFHKYGDPLVEKRTPAGEAARYLNEIVLQYRGNDCLYWPYSRDQDGYGKIRLGKKNYSVHRVVCIDVNGPPPSNQHLATHSCGQGKNGCCARAHLRWGNAAQNAADMILHGTIRYGEKNSAAKLTVDDVKKIRTLKNMRKNTEIAQIFGVTPTTIGNIYKGKIWSWLD